MHTQRHYAALVAFALAGCAEPAAPLAPAGLESCSRYRDTVPHAYERCVLEMAIEAPDVASLNALCANAGDLRGECHAQWVERHARLGRVASAILLEACGVSSDCTLRVLDDHPDPDLLVQISRCAAAGAFEGFCVTHAVRRWASLPPDVADVERVLAATGRRQPEVVGPALGMLAACRGLGSCPAPSSAIGAACVREAEQARQHPSRCYGAGFAQQPAPGH